MEFLAGIYTNKTKNKQIHILQLQRKSGFTKCSPSEKVMQVNRKAESLFITDIASHVEDGFDLFMRLYLMLCQTFLCTHDVAGRLLKAAVFAVCLP